ncbi:MAG: helix-turn-helix transcriptional regulator [Lachnospiraceae bacterium]|nr:helix-turn-helix transcriptional regulator [Lachnospiraceae bacterium]
MAEDFVPYPHIRDMRERHNLTQTQVAEVLNCTQTSYSYYEIGRRDIPTQQLIRLAKYYKTSTDYLLGLTNNDKPYR